jgi:hypothetical protein
MVECGRSVLFLSHLVLRKEESRPMLELSLRSGSLRRPPSDNRAILRFERLEERVVANGAPVVDGFYVMQYLPNKQVVVAGHVQDDMPGCTVTFSGVASGMTSCNAQGQFQTTLTASQLGQITATARDFKGLTSAGVSLTLTNYAPVIQNFQAVQNGNMWTFSGKVMDEAAQGLVVQLTSGMPDLTSAGAQVQADGTFSYTVELNNAMDFGTVAANCTDWWGAQANTVSYTV